MARRHFRLTDLAELIEQRGALPNARERRQERREAERQQRGDRGEGAPRPGAGPADTPAPERGA
jgi:hypothetical protein